MCSGFSPFLLLVVFLDGVLNKLLWSKLPKNQTANRESVSLLTLDVSLTSLSQTQMQKPLLGWIPQEPTFHISDSLQFKKITTVCLPVCLSACPSIHPSVWLFVPIQQTRHVCLSSSLFLTEPHTFTLSTLAIPGIGNRPCVYTAPIRPSKGTPCFPRHTLCMVSTRPNRSHPARRERTSQKQTLHCGETVGRWTQLSTGCNTRRQMRRDVAMRHVTVTLLGRPFTRNFTFFVVTLALESACLSQSLSDFPPI